jgi:hypothetical protein
MVVSKEIPLSVRTIKSMEWMVAALKWQYRETKLEMEGSDDTEVSYSPELKEAMDVLDLLKKKENEPPVSHS